MKLKCSGKSSSDVDVRMQLNISIFSPINFTSLEIRRKKTCLRDPDLGTCRILLIVIVYLFEILLALNTAVTVIARLFVNFVNINFSSEQLYLYCKS